MKHRNKDHVLNNEKDWRQKGMTLAGLRSIMFSISGAPERSILIYQVISQSLTYGQWETEVKERLSGADRQFFVWTVQAEQR